MSLIGIWLLGDLYKMSYYQSTNSPLQLVLCAFFQCATDCAIMSQFWVYRKKNMEIAQKQSAQMKADGLQKTGKPYSATELFEQTKVTTTSADGCDDLSTVGSSDGGRRSIRRPLSPHLVTL